MSCIQRFVCVGLVKKKKKFRLHAKNVAISKPKPYRAAKKNVQT